MCLVFYKFLKLYLPGMVNFPLYLHSCLSQYPINLSGYLLNLLHQEVLVEILCIQIRVRWGWSMLYFRTYWLYNACRIYQLMWGQWYGYMMLRLHILSCDWAIGSGNDGAAFGTCVVIGWAGICLGNGIGWCVLNFLLSPALPWPILGLGIGWVGCPLSPGCTNKVGCMLCIGSVDNDLCLPGLTCGFRTLFMDCVFLVLWCH